MKPLTDPSLSCPCAYSAISGSKAPGKSTKMVLKLKPKSKTKNFRKTEHDALYALAN